jgi:hypothetical protein
VAYFFHETIAKFKGAGQFLEILEKNGVGRQSVSPHAARREGDHIVTREHLNIPFDTVCEINEIRPEQCLRSFVAQISSRSPITTVRSKCYYVSGMMDDGKWAGSLGVSSGVELQSLPRYSKS